MSQTDQQQAYLNSLCQSLVLAGSADRGPRVNGEQQLLQHLSASPSTALPGFIEIACSASTPQPVAMLSAITAKNHLCDVWEEDDGTDIEPLKASLVRGLGLAAAPVRRILLECLRLVLYVTLWPELPEALLPVLAKPSDYDSELVFAAAQAMYVVVRRFKNQGLVARDKQNAVADRLLPVLPPLFSLNRLDLSHTALKIFEALFATNSPSALKEQSYFNGWMEHLLSFPQNNASALAAASTATTKGPYTFYVKCMKRIGLIANFFISELLLPLKKRAKLAKPFAAGKFDERFAQLMMSWLRHVAPMPFAQRSQHLKAFLPAINYLKQCAQIERLYKSLPAADICANLCFPFLPFNDNDRDLWEEDPAEYLRQIDDPEQQELGERNVAMRCIEKWVVPVVRKFSYHTFDHLTQFLHHLVGALTQRESQDQLDAALFALGQLRKIILKTPALASQMEGILTAHVAPHLQSPRPVLRAKAIWLCGVFARAPFQNAENFHNMFQCVLSGIDDPASPVRIQVISALIHFITMKNAEPVLRRVLLPIFKECLRLTDSINNEQVVLTLQCLLEEFGVELSGEVQDAAATLRKSFLAAQFDLTSLDPTERQNLRRIGASESVCRASLSALAGLVIGCGHRQDVLSTVLQPIVAEIAAKVFAMPEALMLLELVLDVMKKLLFHLKGDAISEQMWGIFPMLCRCITDEGGIDYFEQFMPVLDNYVTGAPAHFCTPERLGLIQQVLTKTLNEDGMLIGDQLASPMLMQSMIQQCRPVRPALDGFVPTLVNLALGQLASRTNPRMKAALILVVIDAFYYDSALTIAHMDAVGATAFFFPALFDFCDKHAEGGSLKQRHFGHHLERKQLVLGLSSAMVHLASQSGSSPERAELARSVAKAGMPLVIRMIRANQPANQKLGDRLMREVRGEHHNDNNEAYDSDAEDDDEIDDMDDDDDDGDDNDDIEVPKGLVGAVRRGHVPQGNDDNYDGGSDDDDFADANDDDDEDDDGYTTELDSHCEASVFQQAVTTLAQHWSTDYAACVAPLMTADVQSALQGALASSQYLLRSRAEHAEALKKETAEREVALKQA